jgi:hypothetical protein
VAKQAETYAQLIAELVTDDKKMQAGLAKAEGDLNAAARRMTASTDAIGRAAAAPIDKIATSSANAGAAISAMGATAALTGNKFVGMGAQAGAAAIGMKAALGGVIAILGGPLTLAVVAIGAAIAVAFKRQAITDWIEGVDEATNRVKALENKLAGVRREQEKVNTAISREIAILQGADPTDFIGNLQQQALTRQRNQLQAAAGLSATPIGLSQDEQIRRQIAEQERLAAKAGELSGVGGIAGENASNAQRVALANVEALKNQLVRMEQDKQDALTAELERGVMERRAIRISDAEAERAERYRTGRLNAGQFRELAITGVQGRLGQLRTERGIDEILGTLSQADREALGLGGGGPGRLRFGAGSLGAFGGKAGAMAFAQAGGSVEGSQPEKDAKRQRDRQIKLLEDIERKIGGGLGTA